MTKMMIVCVFATAIIKQNPSIINSESSDLVFVLRNEKNLPQKEHKKCDNLLDIFLSIMYNVFSLICDGRMGERASFCFPISFSPTKASHLLGKY